MADANPKVMDLIRDELKKNPDITNAELLEKAKAVDKSVTKLSARQFNATYPLQVKRQLKPSRKRGGAKKKPARGRGRAKTKTAKRAARTRQPKAAAGADRSRDDVRKVLLQLAKDVAGADKGGVVDVVGGIEKYVDRVVKAAG